MKKDENKALDIAILKVKKVLNQYKDDTKNKEIYARINKLVEKRELNKLED